MASLKADGPLALLPTPAQETGKDDIFTTTASEMTLVHNMLIRCYNSIYLQAPKVKPVDVPDFLQYCLVWQDGVHIHHTGEEEFLFPMIEEHTGKKGIMDTQVNEHATFHDGFDKFKNCVEAAIKDPSKYKPAELIAILDSFGEALHKHLANEPPALAALAPYDIDIKACLDKAADHSIRNTSLMNQLPILWFNLDKEFEGGRWPDFPTMPWVVKWVMINVLGRWRSNWWRFGSSGSDGVQRPLLCLTAEYNAS